MLEKLSTKAWFLLAVILLLVLLLLNWLSPFRIVSNYIFNPIQASIYSLSSGTSDFFHNIFSSSSLAQENEELRKQLIDSQLSAIKQQELLEENEYLRNELNYVQQSDNSFVLAKVIGRPFLQNELLLIDRGSNDGIIVGLPVIANLGILVGKVIEVEKNRSFVALLTNADVSVAAAINNEQRTQGVVQGNLGISLLMDLIPIGEQISEGDLVYSSGLEENINKKFLIGSINSIISSDNELFQRAEVTPATNYNNLTFLTVILP